MSTAQMVPTNDPSIVGEPFAVSTMWPSLRSRPPRSLNPPAHLDQQLSIPTSGIDGCAYRRVGEDHRVFITTEADWGTLAPCSAVSRGLGVIVIVPSTTQSHALRMRKVEAMSSQYAKGTNVDASSSRGEIERTLMRYGAAAFGYAVEDTGEHSRAAVSFVAHGRQIKMVVEMPSKSERRFTHTPSRGVPRTSSAALAEYEQAYRQKWRALALLVKALLESVESGIITFKEAFLPFTMVPGTGQTVSEHLMAELENAITTGAPPRLSLTSNSTQTTESTSAR